MEARLVLQAPLAALRGMRYAADVVEFERKAMDEKMITPGGNPICERCKCMKGPGNHDCLETLSRVLELSGPDEFPSGYFRYLAEKELREKDEENDD